MHLNPTRTTKCLSIPIHDTLLPSGFLADPAKKYPNVFGKGKIGQDGQHFKVITSYFFLCTNRRLHL